jgi:hypothetical protein
MPITVDIVGVGPVEFPDGMSKEAMESALKRLPAPNKAPPPTTVVPSNQSNYVVGDVPSVVGQYVEPKVNAPEPKIPMIDRVQALGEVPLALGSSAIAQTVGPAYGVISNVLSPEFGTQEGMRKSENAGGAVANALTYRPRSQTANNLLQSVSEVVDTAKLPPYLGKIGIGEIPSFSQAARVAKPFVQEAGRAVGETVLPVANKVATALRTADFVPKGIVAAAPTAEALAQEAGNLYAATKKGNVAFKPEVFGAEMGQVGKELRELGYHPKLHPDVKVALDELKNTKAPKDMLELQALREFITNAQGSQNPKEKMLATVLKDKFDQYILNAPKEVLATGSPESIKTWEKARDAYSRMRKSEVFTDMLEKAELDKTKFSMSGTENSLTAQLRQLAKNDKKMKLFSPAEQEAIKQAAKGGNVQNLMRYFGKFAPTGPVSVIAPLMATAASAPLGLAATAGAMGARIAATKMRKSDVEKLAAMMRAGTHKKVKKESK